MKTPAVLTLVVAGLMTAACDSEPQLAAETDAAPLTVEFGRAELVALPRPFEAGGVLRARNTAIIASRVMAPITAVHVRPGDRVKRGAPLVTLDARESTAHSARASAAYMAATEASRSAEADTRTAEAQLRLARASHDRISALHQKRSATTQELDQTIAALAAAEAQVAAAQARTASALAARDAAQAAQDAASVGVSYSVLSAPFDGVVIGRSADPGSMATPGAPLLTIEDPALFRLEVQLDEARTGSIEVGQTIEYRLDNADGDYWNSALVTEIGRVDPLTHSFIVKVDLPSTVLARSGSFGRVRFQAPPRRTLAVPNAAVVRRGQLTIVFTVDLERRARLRPVSTGFETDDRVEVLAGVAANDTIIVNPPAGLVDGTLVVRQ